MAQNYHQIGDGMFVIHVVIVYALIASVSIVGHMALGTSVVNVDLVR